MAINIGLGLDKTNTSGNTTTSGTQTTQTIIGQEAVNKIIKDVMGSDQGLASLAGGENVAGLSGTSVKTMLASDLVAKLVGEIGKLQATTVTNFDQQQDTSASTFKKSGGLKTVICTELERQGKLDTELYLAGTAHFLSLSETTVRGYRVWANKVVPLMQRSERLSNALAPIVRARYLHITGRKHNLVGWITVHLCQPICTLIGVFVPAGEQYAHIQH